MHVDPFQSSLCEAVLREYSINQDAEKEETNTTKETTALKAECPASRERDRNCYWKEVREGWGHSWLELGGGGECLECSKHLCLIRNKMRNFPGSGAFKQCAEGLEEARMGVTLGEGFRPRKQLEQRQEGNYLQLPRCFLTAETKT